MIAGPCGPPSGRGECGRWPLAALAGRLPTEHLLQCRQRFTPRELAIPHRSRPLGPTYVQQLQLGLTTRHTMENISALSHTHNTRTHSNRASSALSKRFDLKAEIDVVLPAWSSLTAE